MLQLNSLGPLPLTPPILALPIFTMQSIEVRWDWCPDKAASNLEKHKVSFELAAVALEDPWRLTRTDDDADEYREVSIATVGDEILVIAHTDAELERYSGQMVGRIMSARKAKPFERRAYYNG